MGTPRRARPLSPTELRRLGWPKGLLAGRPLTGTECYQTGRVLVKEVWGGRADKSHEVKAWSLRRVCETLDAGSPAALSRYVQIYEFVADLKLERFVKSTSATKLLLIARLPKKARTKLARRVLEERWTKARIREEIPESRPKATRPSPRRPRKVTFVAALRTCARAPLLAGVDMADELPARTIRTALKRIEQVTSDLRLLKNQLRKYGGAARQRPRRMGSRGERVMLDARSSNYTRR